MKIDSYNLQFITPCFCAGAEQSVAEVRAPSIRGKLRWWFRVLGGNVVQENEVFGSISDKLCKSSALIVRVVLPDKLPDWQPSKFRSESNTGYLLYYAKASGDGVRWNPAGAIPCGVSFELQVLWKRKVSVAVEKLFNLALDSFLLFGSLGLRSTRGLGCFETKEFVFNETNFASVESRILACSPVFKFQRSSVSCGSADLLDRVGAQLRGLRKGCPAEKFKRPNPSPLGISNPRQTSAVYLRPVKVDLDRCDIVVFEVPACKVLDTSCRRSAPLIGNGLPLPLDKAVKSRRF